MEWYKSNVLKEVRINAPKGSLVLWDSRTIHQNSPPLKGRENPRWRYVVYSCMLPADKILQKDKIKKSEALKNLRMTTHWPYPVYLFPEKARNYGKVLPELNTINKLPELSPLAMKLAGLDEY